MNIKGILKGQGLSSLKPSDFEARITYHNSIKKEAPIKVNKALLHQTTSSDLTIPGYEFAHTFVVNNFTEFSTMTNEGEFSFVLNLADIEVKQFSEGVLIELYSKTSNNIILPFFYSGFYNINKKEMLSFSFLGDTGKIDAETNLYNLEPTFTFGLSKDISSSDKKKIESAISVYDIPSENIVKT